MFLYDFQMILSNFKFLTHGPNIGILGQTCSKSPRTHFCMISMCFWAKLAVLRKYNQRIGYSAILLVNILVSVKIVNFEQKCKCRRNGTYYYFVCWQPPESRDPPQPYVPLLANFAQPLSKNNSVSWTVISNQNHATEYNIISLPRASELSAIFAFFIEFTKC